MNDTDLQSDEEILEGVSREDHLTSGALGKPRTLRGLKLNPPTMESMSYLWELKNYFVYRDANGKVARNNPVIGIAEFVYVHHGDIDEVAEIIADKTAMRQKLREYINGPLSGWKTLEEAMPVIESMLSEYSAAQTEVEASAKTSAAPMGKGRARAGKQRISR